MVIDHPNFDELCSPTSTSMFLSYLLNREINPKEFALGSYDQKLGRFGSWPFNIAHAFEVSGGKYYFHTERLKSFKHLHDYLCNSIPVVVSIRGPINGGARPYKNGHIILVIGYNNQNKKQIFFIHKFTSLYILDMLHHTLLYLLSFLIFFHLLRFFYLFP